MASMLGQLVSKVKAWQSEHLPAAAQAVVGGGTGGGRTGGGSQSGQNNRSQQVPAQLDLHYITDTLLVASQPTDAPEPTFLDTGRDVWHDRDRDRANKNSQQARAVQSSSEVAAAAAAAATSIQEGEGGPGDTDQDTSTTCTTEQPPHPPLQEQLDQLQRLDQQLEEATVHYSPSGSVGNSSGSVANSHDSDRHDHPRTPAAININTDAASQQSRLTATQAQQQSQQRPRPRQTRGGNSPATLCNFLEQRHGRHDYLVFSLSDQPPDDRTQLLLRRQIVQLPWQSAGRPASETPTIVTMLGVCYALSAWLHQDAVNHDDNDDNSNHDNDNDNNNTTKRPKKVALLYCANGKTRSAIAAACYLKFTGQVDTTRDGFGHFLERRCPDSGVAAEDVLRQLPASLHTFFTNFDECLQLGTYMNTKPLMLRAIALQGIPVDEMPCLDLWDAAGRHVYSSHAALWDNVVETNPAAAAASGSKNSSRNDPSLAQWSDEEGFYRVNVILEGDFCLLCRFGGTHAQDNNDSSKIIFRYANTTGFLGAGTSYELSPGQVDLMRRYAHYLDQDDFLLSLLFESHWNCENPQEAALLMKECSEEVLPAIREGFEAMEQGWHVITEHHSARPTDFDVDRFLRQYSKDLVECPRHLMSLALRLTNFEWKAAHAMLLTGSIKSWWLPDDEELSDEWSESSPFGGDSPSNLLYTSSIMTPHPGDVANAFAPSGSFEQSRIQRQPLEMGVKPLFPMVRGKAGAVRQDGQDIRGLLEMMPPLEDPNNAGAVELLMQLNHTGITLDDLLHLREASRNWNANGLSRGAQLAASAAESKDEPKEVQAETDAGKNTNDENDGKGDTNGAAADSGENGESKGEPPLKDDPEYSKYFKMLKMGTPMGAVQNALLRDGKEPSIMDLDPEKSLKSQTGGGDQGGDETPLKDDPEYSKYFMMLKMGTPMGAVQKALLRDGKDPLIMNFDPAKSLKSQTGGEDEGDGEPPLKDDPEYSKYFKMLKMGTPMGAVQNALLRAGKDPSIMDLDPEKSLKSQTGGEDEGDDGPPLKDDPEYSKYFKMLKMGTPMGAVQNALQKDGKDPSIMDLDPAKSVKSQTGGGGKDDGPPLKDDPEYSKYFKMLKMGTPMGAVQNALHRDGKDPSIMDLDPEKSLKSQTGGGDEGDDGPPLREDPEYSKYFKMLKMGTPMGAVQNALHRDGKDPSVMDLDPEKSLKSQTGGGGKDDGPPLKDDPDYAKFFKMLKMRLPMGAVKNALQKEGKDPSIMDLDPEKSLKSQTGGGNKDDGPPLKDDPEYAKFFKMLKMGLPMGAVKNALQKEDKDPSIMDLDPEKSLNSQTGGGGKDDGPPLKDDPEYAKFFKMIKMGLPMGAVKNALQKEDKDPSIMDLDPEKSLKSQTGGSGSNGREVKVDDGPPLKDDPEYAKYFKMVKMGLPAGAIKNAIERDGKDASIMDLDPSKSIASQRKPSSVRGQRAMAKKPRVRRKKIYWNPIDPGRIKEDSLWSLVKDRARMDHLTYDVKEFADLFTESADPSAKKSSTTNKKSAVKAKKAVQVIDGKRDMNGGIILLRLRIEYGKIAKMVNKM
jgi:hypothetical protein